MEADEELQTGAAAMRLLDSGYTIVLFRNRLSSYTAAAFHHELHAERHDYIQEYVQDISSEFDTDGFTPGQALNELADKITGN